MAIQIVLTFHVEILSATIILLCAATTVPIEETVTLSGASTTTNERINMYSETTEGICGYSVWL